MSAVEVTKRYATTVPDLAAAWAFVMAWVDACGESPRIAISPMWTYDDTNNGTRQFEVAVSGMTEEDT